MTPTIVAAGLQTTVQDLGRPGHQRQGVPVGGAMDRVAFRAANILVGNAPGAAALETTLIGPGLSFDRDTVVAVAGADVELTIDGVPVPTWHAILVPAGATLRVGRTHAGCRAYVAVSGGIDVPEIFGSRSTYLRAGFGGHEGRALRVGDRLSTLAPSSTAERIAAALRADGRQPAVARWSIGPSVRGKYGSDVTVRLVADAHTDALDAESRDRLFEEAFRVSSSSDRMGYRLEGVPLATREKLELISEGVVFGTVQLPPGGAPIVLMADAQTTGGYPRIGAVCTADLPLVAQLKPGDRLRFRLVSLFEAQRLYFARERELAQARIAIDLRYARGMS